jgi:nucleoside-diphosphate-sugar epimerase
MSRPRSALLTGATGLIGSVLVERLLAEGVKVYALARPGSKLTAPANVIPVSSFETDDLRDALAAFSCDTVFHLASYGVQPHDRDHDQLIDGNVRLLSHVLQAVSGWPLQRFIFTGSCAEYGFYARENIAISEDQPLRPASLYGAAKASAELYGHALATQLKIPFVTLRLFNVFGPGEKPHRLLPSIIDALENERPVELTGGEQQRDLLHVDDVADALLTAANSESLRSLAAYNICSGVPVSIRQVVEIAAELLGRPQRLLQWGKLPYRSDEPMWVVGDPSRFFAVTPWRPKISLEAGIERMITVRRKNANREPHHAV